MKRIHLSLITLLLCFAAKAQFVTVQAISPTGDGGFETGTTLGANGWTYAGDGTYNMWWAGTGSGTSAGVRAGYIGTSATNGDPNYPSNQVRNHMYRLITVPATASNVRLSFKRKQTYGEGGWDFFGVYRTSSVPTSGTYPPTGGIAIFGPVSDYGGALASFQPFGPFNLDATIGTSFYLSFTYSNGDACCGLTSTGNPAVDEISLTYDVPCTPPAAISGTLSLCQFGTTTLSSATPGGTWASSNGTIASVTPSGSSCVVNGLAVGTANIMYTVAGCPRTVTVTVNPSPTVNVTPATTSICFGSSTSIAATSAFGGNLTLSSGTINLGIPDANPVGGTHTLSTSAVPAGATITGVAVTINLAHTWVSDMVINIKAPNGNILNLFNQHGGSGDNMTNTVISSNGVTPIASGTPPFTGTFAAAAAMGGGPTGFASNVSTFSSLYSVPNGNWTLALQDLWGGDVPTLISWSVTISYTSAPSTVWSPTTGLFTDAALTTPYTGGNLLTVYAAPSATTVYSASATAGGCTTVRTSNVNINPVPGAITGTATVCETRTTTLSSPSAGGTWSSSSPGVASVSGSGSSATVTGGMVGTSVITYMFGSGCYTTRTVTVLPTPLPINGTANVCEAGTTTLTHPDGGTGTWSSANASVATIGLTSGIVSGVSNGYATISYTGLNGCARTRTVTVNPLPVVSVLPGTSATLCLNQGQTFSSTSPAPQLTLLSQDFNSGLSGWTITNAGGLPASHWQITTPPGLTGFGGDGSDYLQAASSASPSPNPLTHTTITSPSFATTGGFASATLSFNQYLFSFAPPDVLASIEYSIDGGSTWSTIDNQAGDVINDNGDDGDWEASSPEFSATLPPAAIGQSNVKIRFVYNAQSLYWLIDNISVKGTMPASTFAWSGPGGLSCTACAASTLTPTVSGTNAYNLAVTTSAGCVTNTPVTLNVNALPTPIAGSLTVCDNSTSILTSSPVGTWESSDPSKATITSGTGVLAGVEVGTSNITYTASSTGCQTISVATVLPAPAVITPSSVALCLGNTATLSTTSPGGVWSSSDVTIVPISPSGSSVLVTAAASGTASIAYSMPNGCMETRDVVVNPLPANIGGSSQVCIDATTTLTNTDPLGTWMSDNSGIASVNATTGEVMGVTQGNTYITYTLPTGCYKVKAMQVNPLPNATTGASSICMGNTTVLFNTTGGGVWSSSAPAIASVNSSGVVTAGSFAASADIYYTLAGTGCRTAHNIVVNPLPQAITGPTRVCKDASVTFSDADPFGTWTSGDATIASVDGSGVVTGMSVGNTRITYTLPTGCMISKVISVNPLPNNISGPATVCYGTTANLLNTTPSGTWTSSDISIATVNSIGQVTPVSAVGGGVTITYAITATGCYKTRDMVVNPLPDPITGTTTLCQQATTTLSSASSGGTWVSGNTSVFVINASSGMGTAISAGSTNVTYSLPTGCRTTRSVQVNPLPQDIFGTLEVCAGRQTTLGTLSTGGNWVSSDPSVATVNGSGVVTGGPVSVASTANISYVFSTGCYKSEQVVVYPLPGTISGDFSICVGTTTDLSSPDGGGAWTSSSPTVASVNVLGTVTGNNAGGTIITYTLPTGCMRTQAVVVNPLPGPITGTASVCEGLTTDLNNTTAGGSWSSETPSVGTVDAASGLVTGIDDGTTNIIYTLPTGCSRSRAVVVHITPDAISGTPSACIGQTSLLSSNPGGGTWTSGSSSVASVNSVGLVTANTAGAANITYTLPAGSCRTVSSFVSNPLPGPIGGTRVICQGASSTLSNPTPDGVWSTVNGFVASIDGGTGVMDGNTPGVTSVAYTLNTTGCARSANVTVNALPQAITGATSLCVGTTTNLSTMSTGGTWSSNNPSVASVSNTGVVTGNAAGTADIAYTFGTGCRTTATVVVNGLPADITGATSVCLGQQATVSNSTGGGTWDIDNTSIADIDINGVITGLAVGSVTVKYTVDATGCYKTKPFTVNPLPAAIMGNMGICQGATSMLSNTTPGGTWSSSNTSVATINSGTGLVSALTVGFSIVQYTLPTGCSANGTVVVNPLPEPITGIPTVCVGGTTQLESNTMGGTWSSSNAAASVSPSGLVTGVAAGSANIIYTTGNGCRRIRPVNVNPLPGLITGASSVCPGTTAALGNSASGGTWNSDDLSVATISSTGVVTPVITTGGTANITYTLPTGCARSRAITVPSAVDAITGSGIVCKGSTTTLSNTMTGGAWSSSNTATATVNTAGVVTGTGAGVATIAYTMPTGCKATMVMVVNPLPGNISGPASVCNGSSVTLGNTVAGGTWSSSDETKATISSTGVVTGEDAGSATITYTLATNCMVTRGIVVNSLPAIKNVIGGGAYCATGAGISIGLDGSEPGMLYKLMNGGTTPVIAMTGGGGVINFGNQTNAGGYNVVAVTPEGCMQNMNGTATIVINPLITPTVILASDKGSTVCAGTSVTFSATGTGGGSTPTYNWMVNGIDMSTTAAYTYVPVNGDIVSIKYTSSEVCASPTNVTSQMAMTVRANLAPSITVNVTPGAELCAGQTATYTTAIENGGAAPTYSWLVDGSPIAGATNSTFSYIPADADLVVAKLNSSYGCATVNNVSSNGVTMDIAPVFVPVVVVNAQPGTVVPEGTEVTYTATVSNAGPSPAYQWFVNMEEIAGATNPVFKTSSLNDGDSVTCRVQGTGVCSKASINSVKMTITPSTGVVTTLIGNSEIRLVPNPNTGVFTISGTLATKTDEAVSFEVTNMLGQVVYTGNTTAKAGVVEARIELGKDLANGMYMLNMAVGTERKSFHFVMKQ